MAQDSIFTKIIKGEIPAHKIYEDEKVLAFLDIHPVRAGHTLVIPKTQVDHIDELEDDDYSHLMAVVKKLSLHLKKNIDCIRVAQVVFGLDVPHAHVHLIPLHDGSEISLQHDMQSDPDQEALAETAKSLQIS